MSMWGEQHFGDNTLTVNQNVPDLNNIVELIDFGSKIRSSS